MIYLGLDISDDVKNYDYIEVYYKSRQEQQTSRKGMVQHYTESGIFSSYLEVFIKDGNYLIIDGCNVFITGNRATFKGNEAKRYSFNEGEIHIGNTEITLYKVLGFKN